MDEKDHHDNFLVILKTPLKSSVRQKRVLPNEGEPLN